MKGRIILVVLALAGLVAAWIVILKPQPTVQTRANTPPHQQSQTPPAVSAPKPTKRLPKNLAFAPRHTPLSCLSSQRNTYSLQQPLSNWLAKEAKSRDTALDTIKRLDRIYGLHAGRKLQQLQASGNKHRPPAQAAPGFDIQNEIAGSVIGGDFRHLETLQRQGKIPEQYFDPNQTTVSIYTNIGFAGDANARLERVKRLMGDGYPISPAAITAVSAINTHDPALAEFVWKNRAFTGPPQFSAVREAAVHHNIALIRFWLKQGAPKIDPQSDLSVLDILSFPTGMNILSTPQDNAKEQALVRELLNSGNMPSTSLAAHHWLSTVNQLSPSVSVKLRQIEATVGRSISLSPPVRNEIKYLMHALKQALPDTYQRWYAARKCATRQAMVEQDKARTSFNLEHWLNQPGIKNLSPSQVLAKLSAIDRLQVGRYRGLVRRQQAQTQNAQSWRKIIGLATRGQYDPALKLALGDNSLVGRDKIIAQLVQSSQTPLTALDRAMSVEKPNADMLITFARNARTRLLDDAMANGWPADIVNQQGEGVFDAAIDSANPNAVRWALDHGLDGSKDRFGPKPFDRIISMSPSRNANRILALLAGAGIQPRLDTMMRGYVEKARKKHPAWYQAIIARYPQLQTPQPH